MSVTVELVLVVLLCLVRALELLERRVAMLERKDQP